MGSSRSGSTWIRYERLLDLSRAERDAMQAIMAAESAAVGYDEAGATARAA